MTGVNEMNAVMREQARIREAVCTLEHFIRLDDTPKNVMVRRADVLAILDGSRITHDSIGYSPWPNNGDIFYRLNSQGYVIEAPWTGSPKQKSFLEYGNVFKTRDQAERAKEKIIEVFTFTPTDEEKDTIRWQPHGSLVPKIPVVTAMPHQRNCDIRSNHGIPKAQKDESHCNCKGAENTDLFKDSGFEQRGAAVEKEGDLD